MIYCKRCKNNRAWQLSSPVGNRYNSFLKIMLRFLSSGGAVFGTPLAPNSLAAREVSYLKPTEAGTEEALDGAVPSKRWWRLEPAAGDPGTAPGPYNLGRHHIHTLTIPLTPPVSRRRPGPIDPRPGERRLANPDYSRQHTNPKRKRGQPNRLPRLRFGLVFRALAFPHSRSSKRPPSGWPFSLAVTFSLGSARPRLKLPPAA